MVTQQPLPPIHKFFANANEKNEKAQQAVG
jgi:hypothetical protein